MKTIFWLSLVLIIYTYVGYPMLLAVLARLRPRPVRYRDSDRVPVISLIIAVYNEERNLMTKLVNTLNLRYPRERVRIIVVSDGSTDGTAAIARSFAGQGVELVRLPERMGKAIALNYGVVAARGEILVFTDAGALAEPDCLWNLIENFSDPEVGCVSTEDVLENSSESGEGTYIKYEMLLRKLESRVASCVGASGSFYAMRRECCPQFPPHVATDLLSAMEAVRLGFRVVSDPRSLVRMTAVIKQGDEFQRKVRTVMTGIGCLSAMLPLLNPFRCGIFSIEIFSHKILRWGGGIMLLALFAGNAFIISDSRLYASFFCFQVAAYLLAAIGGIFEPLSRKFAVVRIPYFFVCTNLSALFAFYKYIAGQRVAVWRPSNRGTLEARS